MKIKEYFRLAKISLKSRKKTTKSTVRGISFGLILLVPIIFLAMGLYSDLNKKINENPHAIYTKIIMAAERYNMPDQQEFYDSETGNYVSALIGSNNMDKLLQVGDNTCQKVVYEKLYSRGSSSAGTVNVNGAKYSIDSPNFKDFKINASNELNDGSYDTQKKYEDAYTSAAVFDLEKSNKGIFVEKIVEKFDNKIFVDNMDKGFTDGGKGQVILSEKLINELGYTAEQVYGKKFSVQITQNYSIDSNSNPNDYDQNDNFSLTGYLCYEYEVVGIVKKQVTEYCANMDPDHANAVGMYFSKASMVMPDGSCLEAVSTTITNDNYSSTYYTYLQLDELKTLNKEYMLIPTHNFAFSSISGYRTCGQETIFYQPASYQANSKIVSEIASKIKAVYPTNAVNILSNSTFSDSSGVSPMYQQFNLVFMVFNIVTIAFVTIGGIIFFASMVNLFNTIMHSVDSRKNYLGVMRAIGAKKSVIPKLYVYESFAIFNRALIWVYTFGIAICVGIKIGLDFAFKKIGNVLGVALSINWIYILVTLAAITGVLLLLGWSFAYGCSRKLASKTITDILTEGN